MVQLVNHSAIMQTQHAELKIDDDRYDPVAKPLGPSREDIHLVLSHKPTYDNPDCQ